MGKIKIAEMLERREIDDSDLIIVEDDFDTKQSTVGFLKRNFSGDSFSPASNRFYSSKRVSELTSGLEVNMSTLAKKSDVDHLSQQLNNVITQLTGNPPTDPAAIEVATARHDYDTLDDRLDGDELEREKKYIQYPEITARGTYFDFSNIDDAKINIKCVNVTNNFVIKIRGTNRFPNTSTYPNVIKEDNGVKITYTTSSYQYDLVTDVLELGEYVLYHNATFSDNFVKEGAVLRLKHNDNSYSTVDTYAFANTTTFVATKPVVAIQIVPNSSTITNNMWLKLENIMISKSNSLKKYYPYYYEELNCTAGTEVFSEDRFLSRVIIEKVTTLDTDNNILTVTLVDTSFTGQVIKERIEKLESKLYTSDDYCGLIEEPGTYIPAYNNTYIDSTELCFLSNDTIKARNGYPSVKITQMECDQENRPGFTLILPSTTDFTNVELFSVQLYINRDIADRFTDSDGIKIMISSDDPYSRTNPPANYITMMLGNGDFVQGWNTIKVKISDFATVGHPNLNRITMVGFSMCPNINNNNKSIWINSIILDQRMTPTVLFAFDHLYISSNSFNASDNRDLTWKFPYMYGVTNDIPATIFCNDKQTLTKIEMEQLSMVINTYGWELGNFGCNPNADTMTYDDNPREQYMSVKQTRQWLLDNFVPSVYSYAAPGGNLRPITETMLKNLGFRIAKASSNKFCSFFSKNDFAIPMHLLANPPGEGGNTDAENNPYSARVIKAKIDEIVNTGQCICIYTSNVTQYGDGISAKQVDFEEVIRHIVKYKNEGRLQCLTFSDFYNKCIG